MKSLLSIFYPISFLYCITVWIITMSGYVMRECRMRSGESIKNLYEIWVYLLTMIKLKLNTTYVITNWLEHVHNFHINIQKIFSCIIKTTKKFTNIIAIFDIVLKHILSLWIWTDLCACGSRIFYHLKTSNAETLGMLCLLQFWCSFYFWCDTITFILLARQIKRQKIN